MLFFGAIPFLEEEPQRISEIPPLKQHYLFGVFDAYDAISFLANKRPQPKSLKPFRLSRAS
jgi:hypothetical protein